MTLLPVIARELRVATRRPWTFRVRWGAAGLLCAAWLLLLAVSPATLPPERLSRHLFSAFGVLCFGPTLLAGVFLTAESISRERSEGTLGLLFLTDLRGYDIVLGKLVSHSVNAVFGLLAALPLLGLPLLMGGVAPAQFFGLNAVLLATLALSLAVGMLASVLARDVRQSIVLTFGVLLGLTGLLPTLWFLLRLTFDTDVLERLLLWPSPAYALERSLTGRDPLSAVGVLVALAVVSIGLACAWLPRGLREETAPSRGVAASESPRLPRPPCPVEDPVSWLTRASYRSRRTLWWVLAPLGLLWAVAWLGLLGNHQLRGFAMVAFGLGFGIHAVFKCLVAFEATQRMSEDAASGALELLLVTPLPAKTMVEGLAAGLLRRLFWPTCTVGLINLLFLLWLAIVDHGPSGSEIRVFAYIFLGGLAVLWLDRAALVWTGLVQGLRRRRHTRAALATCFHILIPPWLLMVLLVFLAEMNVFRRPDGPEAILFAWFVAGGILSWVHWTTSRDQLIHQLRRIAAGDPALTPVDPPAP